ncbi:M48 family metalloprotease [Methanothrix soehngenii]|uniref:M48 family metalloprotease n=1 Tax=Methanothrix soehngenii TaxID=2223 RepID=UPI00300C4A11
MNRLKTTALLGLLTALLLWMGQALGGSTGLAMALVLAGGMNFASYWWSDKIVLAMSGAKPLGEREAPDLHRMVRTLSLKAGIPIPRLYRLAQAAPNAFATGRDPAHGAVAVTEGLLASLDRAEIEGVLAHEIGHIKNRDTLASDGGGGPGRGPVDAGRPGDRASRVATSWITTRAVTPWAGLVGVIVAPLAALLIQAAISRSREFDTADEAAARLSGNPRALASALLKIEALARRQALPTSPAAAHLFIINPLRGGGFSRLPTHPATRERVKRLEALAREGLSWAA